MSERFEIRDGVDGLFDVFDTVLQRNITAASVNHATAIYYLETACSDQRAVAELVDGLPVHMFATGVDDELAYDFMRTSYTVCDGDIFVGNGLVAVLHEGWPIAITVNSHGLDQLSSVDDWKALGENVYLTAVRIAREHEWPVTHSTVPLPITLEEQRAAAHWHRQCPKPPADGPAYRVYELLGGSRLRFALMDVDHVFVLTPDDMYAWCVRCHYAASVWPGQRVFLSPDVACVEYESSGDVMVVRTMVAQFAKPDQAAHFCQRLVSSAIAYSASSVALRGNVVTWIAHDEHSERDGENSYESEMREMAAYYASPDGRRPTLNGMRIR